MSLTAYLDAFSGIYGDMLVGALADAGADQAAITDAIASLDAGAVGVLRKGEALPASAPPSSASRYRRPSTHRHLSHIVKMIEKARPVRARQAQRHRGLPQLGRSRSRRSTRCPSRRFISTKWARPIPSPISWAPASRSTCWRSRPLICSPLNVGSGTVKTEHGMLPVPAPATARCSQASRSTRAVPRVELTTPTGAAVAATLADALRRAAADEDRRASATARATTISRIRPTCCASCSANRRGADEATHGHA